jgi:hypothetical protein
MMTCSICRHEQRSQIDAALIRSDSLRNIAKQFGTSATALHRHKAEHIAEQLSKSKELSDIAAASFLVKELRELTRKTGEVLTRALREKNGDLALKAISRLEKQLELKARLLGELEEKDSGRGPLTVVVQYVDRQLNVAPPVYEKELVSVRGNGAPQLALSQRADEGDK